MRNKRTQGFLIKRKLLSAAEPQNSATVGQALASKLQQSLKITSVYCVL